MSRMRDEAEALARALEFGLCDVAEVIAWADAQILREDRPCEALCDVSLARGRYPQDVAGMLRRLPGMPDKAEVARLLLSLIKERLSREADCADRIASWLYQMALAEEIEDPRLRDVSWWAWDELYLAPLGYTGESREEIVRQMMEALDEATAKTSASWSFAVIGESPNPPQSPESEQPPQPARPTHPNRGRSRFLQILKSWGLSR